MDDGAPTRAETLEAARRVRQAHDAGVRCCWSCGQGCAQLDWAEQVTAGVARRRGVGLRVSWVLRRIG